MSIVIIVSTNILLRTLTSHSHNLVALVLGIFCITFNNELFVTRESNFFSLAWSFELNAVATFLAEQLSNH